MEKIKQLIDELNRASDTYYNSGETIMSDAEFDLKLDELRKLEEETEIVMSNSPTHKVGTKVLDGAKKVKHSHPMLSLKKCHSAQEVLDFARNDEILGLIKCDGLTVSLTYERGILLGAESRGDGTIGTDCLEHIKNFTNVPLKINKSGTYIIDGEAIIYDYDFAEINKNGEFKNSRNLASGTLNCLEPKLAADRKLSFVAWDVIEGSDETTLLRKLSEASSLGFTVVPHGLCENTIEDIDNMFKSMYSVADKMGIPLDGVVYKINDCKKYFSRGRTEHHFSGGIARKKPMEDNITTLRDVIWQTSKTGLINPVAVFDEIDLDGALTTKATLHNLSYIEDLELGIDDEITVIRANEVIPRVTGNLTRSNTLVIPNKCPCCGANAIIKQENNSKALYCTNENCEARLLGKLSHFCGKHAMDIEGLSEATLEFLIDKGWVKSFKDLYHLNNPEIVKIWKATPGFGTKSVDNIINAIGNSRITTLDKLLCAVSIPNIGSRAAKDIAAFSNYNLTQFMDDVISYDCSVFSQIDGIGEKMIISIKNWADENWIDFLALTNELYITDPNKNIINGVDLSGKSFVITGSVNHFKNRDELKEYIESLGGKVSGSVSSKTFAVINNDITSTSSKNKKAKELNIPIWTEEDFINYTKGVN